MGGRSAKQPYGSLDKTVKLQRRAYFKTKGNTPVLLAFFLSSEDLTPTTSGLIAIVTNSGIDVYRLQSSKLVKQIRAEIRLVTAGIQRGKDAMAYVGPDNVVQIAVPAFSQPRDIDFTEKVTALKLVADNFLLVGFITGSVSIATTNDLVVTHVDIPDTHLPVCMFSYTQTKMQSYAVAGFLSDQQSPVYLLSLPDLPTLYVGAYESLPGSCADVSVAEIEKLLIALCEETGSVFIWDLENHNYLLSIDLAKEPLSRMMAFEDPSSAGEVSLVLGGLEGVTVGSLRIHEGSISWTPKSKSQVKDSGSVRSGAVTSLVWERTVELLIVGDDEGQVWLIFGFSEGKPTGANSPPLQAIN